MNRLKLQIDDKDFIYSVLADNVQPSATDLRVYKAMCNGLRLDGFSARVVLEKPHNIEV